MPIDTNIARNSNHSLKLHFILTLVSMSNRLWRAHCSRGSLNPYFHLIRGIGVKQIKKHLLQPVCRSAFDIGGELTYFLFSPPSLFFLFSFSLLFPSFIPSHQAAHLTPAGLVERLSFPMPGFGQSPAPNACYCNLVNNFRI